MEHRRFPGSVSYLWCRTCKNRFGVAGRRRDRKETPVIELIVCPSCHSMRRMVLPVNVGAPFRVLTSSDRIREE
ncbi:MAG TPA: hypothetical protein VFK70_05425 [Vicinamibacteria bacterium]|nr:hypothetical protein [Vicinamibacteria bacterium]